jgi:phosphate uptake regulator
VARQHFIILQNVGLAEKMDITTATSSTFSLISKIIERIGDHEVRIASNVLNLIESKVSEEIAKGIDSAGRVALEIFNKSVGAFFRGDIKAANENIEAVAKLEAQCEEINALALKERGAKAISIGYVIESIRRIGEYAEDISEIAFNYFG